MLRAQTQRGLRQAEEAGRKIKAMMAEDGGPFRLYFYMSPYRRSSQARLPCTHAASLSIPIRCLTCASVVCVACIGWRSGFCMLWRLLAESPCFAKPPSSQL